VPSYAIIASSLSIRLPPLKHPVYSED